MGRRLSPEEKNAKAASLKAKALDLKLSSARQEVDTLLKNNPAYGPKVLKYTQKTINKGTHAMKVKKSATGTYEQAVEIDAMSDVQTSGSDTEAACGAAAKPNSGSSIRAKKALALEDGSVEGDVPADAKRPLDRRWSVLRDMPIKVLKQMCSAFDREKLSPFALRSNFRHGDGDASKSKLCDIITFNTGVDEDEPFDRIFFQDLAGLIDHVADLTRQRGPDRLATMRMPPVWGNSDGEYELLEIMEQWWTGSRFSKVQAPLPRAFQAASSLDELSIIDNFSEKRARVKFGEQEENIFDLLKKFGKRQEPLAVLDTEKGDDDDDAGEKFVTPVKAASRPSGHRGGLALDDNGLDQQAFFKGPGHALADDALDGNSVEGGVKGNPFAGTPVAELVKALTAALGAKPGKSPTSVQEGLLNAIEATSTKPVNTTSAQSTCTSGAPASSLTSTTKAMSLKRQTSLSELSFAPPAPKKSR